MPFWLKMFKPAVQSGAKWCKKCESNYQLGNRLTHCCVYLLDAMGKGLLRAYPPNRRGESHCPRDCPGVRFTSLEEEMAHEIVFHPGVSKTWPLAVTFEWYRRQLLCPGDENQQLNFAQNVVLAAIYGKAAGLKIAIVLPELDEIDLATGLIWTDPVYEPIYPLVK